MDSITSPQGQYGTNQTAVRPQRDIPSPAMLSPHPRSASRVSVMILNAQAPGSHYIASIGGSLPFSFPL